MAKDAGGCKAPHRSQSRSRLAFRSRLARAASSDLHLLFLEAGAQQPVHLAGQGQPGVLYPPNWLLFLAPLRHGWIRQSFLHWYFVLIHFQAGLFCYWLCRDLKRSRAASLLSGLAFGLAGYVGTNNWPQM